jgi:hypothetical protein
MKLVLLSANAAHLRCNMRVFLPHREREKRMKMVLRGKGAKGGGIYRNNRIVRERVRERERERKDDEDGGEVWARKNVAA